MWEQYKKEFFRTDHATALVLRHLALVLLYGCAFLCFYFLSRHFFTHQGWSAWFMPAGLRLAVFIILPWRYWPTLLVTEFFCQRSITIGYGNVPPDMWLAVARTLSKNCIVLIGLIAFVRHWPTVKLHHPRYVLSLLALMLWDSLVNATWLVFVSAFYQDIPAEQKLSMWWAFVSGNQIGIFLLGTPLLGLWTSLRFGWHQRPHHWGSRWRNWQAIGALLVIILAFLLFRHKPDALYLVLSLSLFPAAMLCYLSGWLGAVCGLLIINVATALTLYGQSGTLTMQQLQAFLLLINIAILLFGALMSTQQQLTHDLRQQAQQQAALATRNQQLSDKFSSVLEYERKVLSNALHDELGQVATGLKLQIKALQRHTSAERLDKLGQTVDALYDSIYRLMHQLTPRLLEEKGLISSLTEGPLPQMLSDAQIDYSHHIDNQVEALPKPMQVLLYRAVQEALTNVVKHANASHVWLNLHAQPHQCSLIVENDVGQGGSGDVDDDKAASAGFGLKNIQERVWAAGGVFTTESRQGMFRLHLRLPLVTSHEQADYSSRV